VTQSNRNWGDSIQLAPGPHKNAHFNRDDDGEETGGGLSLQRKKEVGNGEHSLIMENEKTGNNPRKEKKPFLGECTPYKEGRTYSRRLKIGNATTPNPQKVGKKKAIHGKPEKGGPVK